MKKTTHSKLNKPEKHEFYNVDDFNANTDIIDTGLKQVDTISTALSGRGKIYFLRRSEEWNGKVYLYAYKGGEQLSMYNEALTEMKTDDGILYYCDRPSDNYSNLIFHSEHKGETGFPFQNYATLPPRGLYHTPVYVQTTQGTNGFWADQLTQTRKILFQGDWQASSQAENAFNYSGWTFEVWAKNWSDTNRKKYPVYSLGFINVSDSAKVRYFAADIPIETDDFYFSWKTSPDGAWKQSDTYLISGLKDGAKENYLGAIPVWYGLSNASIERITEKDLLINLSGMGWDACYVNAYQPGAARFSQYADLIDPHFSIYRSQWMSYTKDGYKIGPSKDDLSEEVPVENATNSQRTYIVGPGIFSTSTSDMRVNMNSFKGESDTYLMIWWGENYQITTEKLASYAVTKEKLAPGAVTPDKLSGKTKSMFSNALIATASGDIAIIDDAIPGTLLQSAVVKGKSTVDAAAGTLTPCSPSVIIASSSNAAIENRCDLPQNLALYSTPNDQYFDTYDAVAAKVTRNCVKTNMVNGWLFSYNADASIVTWIGDPNYVPNKQFYFVHGNTVTILSTDWQGKYSIVINKADAGIAIGETSASAMVKMKAYWGQSYAVLPVKTPTSTKEEPIDLVLPTKQCTVVVNNAPVSVSYCQDINEERLNRIESETALEAEVSQIKIDMAKPIESAGIASSAVTTDKIAPESVHTNKFNGYLRNIILNPDNLFLDPLMEDSAANWKPGAYNKGVIVHGNNQIIIDGRAEGKRYCAFTTKFDIPAPDAYAFELEIKRLDDTYPISYPITINFFDNDGNNLTNKPSIYPTAAQLKLNQWYKLRVALPTAQNAVKLVLSLGISDTGGYLAYRRPKLVKGANVTIFDRFDFDLNAKLESMNKSLSVSNPFYGASVLITGDSVVADINSYAKTIPVKYEMTYKDLSVTGANIARESTHTSILDRFVNNMAADTKKYDLIIHEGGINDSFNCPLGEITSGYTAVLDETTYCGALESLLRQSLKFYMGKRIGYVITHQLGNAGYNTTLGTYFDKARQICEKYSVPYLDLYKSSGLCCGIPEIQQALFTDAIHPNAAGHAVIASKIEAWMKTL